MLVWWLKTSGHMALKFPQPFYPDCHLMVTRQLQYSRHKSGAFSSTFLIVLHYTPPQNRFLFKYHRSELIHQIIPEAKQAGKWEKELP